MRKGGEDAKGTVRINDQVDYSRLKGGEAYMIVVNASKEKRIILSNRNILQICRLISF